MSLWLRARDNDPYLRLKEGALLTTSLVAIVAGLLGIPLVLFIYWGSPPPRTGLSHFLGMLLFLMVSSLVVSGLTHRRHYLAASLLLLCSFSLAANTLILLNGSLFGLTSLGLDMIALMVGKLTLPRQYHKFIIPIQLTLISLSLLALNLTNRADPSALLIIQGEVNWRTRLQIAASSVGSRITFLLATSFLLDQIIKLYEGYIGLEEELRKQAEDANRLKTEFLGIVSHELRTPLNSIIGYADIMKKGVGVEGPPLSDDAQYLTGRIQDNGKRLLYIINDILDISKIEARRLRVTKQPFSPAALLDSVRVEVEPLASEKQLNLTCSLDPELPEQLVGDANLLRRIVVNLGINAVKFTREGSVRIELKKRADKWNIEVTDTGIGIPSSMLDIIFEPFRQVDSSTRREHGGTGLGLTICRNLAQLMGGFIKVESEVGKGSTFTVVLPLAADESTSRDRIQQVAA